ncbi:purine-nucleoside phosphorylase [Amaricoccus tamworthensis]|uniref:purine-nucleoside phosphorylase n=1 Tax=Amaricoccus tamworthensis TaxID=57002 RepID=UPI003C79ACA9
MIPLKKQISLALSSVEDRVGKPVETALVLGSGLGNLADQVNDPVVIPYGEIEGFPHSTAPDHRGQLVIGDLFGHRCALMQGRMHLYEGWKPQQIALPIYLLKALGSRRMIVTNAAGALNPDYGPGDVMLISDHINLTGHNPLTGPNDDDVGLRFPDMSRAYDPDLRSWTEDAANKALVEIHVGIYAGIAGPSLETSAERRLFRSWGADAVGMSTVMEVIAAAHAELPVIGFSAISNSATGLPDQQPDTIEQVLEHAKVAGTKISKILERLFQQF